MIISDPLELAIISMIVGIVIGAIGAALAVMISNDIHQGDINYPIVNDLDAMWEEYTKGKHER